jgi:D-ribose pyranose/furanose isomerase RbsD
VFIAQEFMEQNTPPVHATLAQVIFPVTCESHVELKKRVAAAMSFLRTADTSRYAKMIFIST